MYLIGILSKSFASGPNNLSNGENGVWPAILRFCNSVARERMMFALGSIAADAAVGRLKTHVCEPLCWKRGSGM